MSRIAELAADGHIAIHALRPQRILGWLRGALRDMAAWRARPYFVLKLPVAAADLLAAVGIRLAGLFYLTYPIWWELAKAGPWLTHAVTEVDRALISSLLGPVSLDSTALAERVRDLEETRAHAVDDSAARLRSIERDLHDGAQAQLVALATKLGLAGRLDIDSRRAAPRQ